MFCYVLLCFVWVLTMHIKLIRVFVEGSWHQDLVAAVPGRLAKNVGISRRPVTSTVVGFP